MKHINYSCAHDGCRAGFVNYVVRATLKRYCHIHKTEDSISINELCYDDDCMESRLYGAPHSYFRLFCEKHKRDGDVK